MLNDRDRDEREKERERQRQAFAEEMARTSAIQRNVQPQNALMGAMYAGLLGPLMQG
jgi:hypothetical protein